MWFISWCEFMRTDLGLKGSELYIYAVIHGFSKSNKPFSGSLKYLNEVTGFTVVQCCNSLKNLVDKGYITKTVISTRKVEYRTVPLDSLNLKEKAAESPPPDNENSDKKQVDITEFMVKTDALLQKIRKKASKV